MTPEQWANDNYLREEFPANKVWQSKHFSVSLDFKTKIEDIVASGELYFYDLIKGTDILTIPHTDSEQSNSP